MTASGFFCSLCPHNFQPRQYWCWKPNSKTRFSHTHAYKSCLWKIVGVCTYQFFWLGHAPKGKPNNNNNNKKLAGEQSSISESFYYNRNARRLQQREMVLNQSQIIEGLAASFPYWMLKEFFLLGLDLGGWEWGEAKFPSARAKSEKLYRWDRSQLNGRGHVDLWWMHLHHRMQST